VGRSRSPQEKKAISYAKDRRNDYGENDKSSRKNIRRRKRDPNRADRHRERQVLASAAGTSVDAVVAEKAERALVTKKSKWYTVRWRKWRDAPLADIVENRLRRRARKGMDDPVLVETRIDRIRRRRVGRG
jgi:glutamate/tyrosine decarboxylase-like PLP-dependent enzyme